MAGVLLHSSKGGEGRVAGVAAFAHKDASFRDEAGRRLLKRLADRL